MSKKSVQDKSGEPIEVGDHVETRFRGGKRAGEVVAVITNSEDTKGTRNLGVDVKNLPKVIFTDQHGHTVSHNPGTLSHTEDK